MRLDNFMNRASRWLEVERNKNNLKCGHESCFFGVVVKKNGFQIHQNV